MLYGEKIVSPADLYPRAFTSEFSPPYSNLPLLIPAHKAATGFKQLEYYHLAFNTNTELVVQQLLLSEIVQSRGKSETALVCTAKVYHLPFSTNSSQVIHHRIVQSLGTSHTGFWKQEYAWLT